MKSKLLASLLFISLLFNFTSLADAAVKTGSACKKVGQTSVVKGKTFTCIKSGKKKVWNKGVPVKTAAPVSIPTTSPFPTPTPSPSISPTPEPSTSPTPSGPLTLEEANRLQISLDPLSGKSCSTKGERRDNQQGFIICEDFNNTPLQWYQSFNPRNTTENPSASPQPSNPYRRTNNLPNLETNVTKFASPLEECRLKETANISGAGSKGFPIRGMRPSTGSFKMAIIPVDFSNAVGVGNPGDMFKDDLQKIIDWGNFYSRGKLSYQPFLASNDWLRAPKGAEWYVCVDCRKGATSEKQSMKQGLQELISLADERFNFSDTQFVYFVFPESAEKNFGTSMYFHNVEIQTNEGIRPVSVYGEMGGHFETSDRTKIWDHIIHELLHFQGLIGHGPLNGSMLGIMSQQWGNSKSVTAWEGFMAGWFGEDEIVCINKEKITESIILNLSSIDSFDGGKEAVIIRLNSEEVLIVERRTNGLFTDFKGDNNIPEADAFTAYLVNVNKPSYRNDTDPDSENKNFWKYLRDQEVVGLKTGVTYSGIKIEVRNKEQLSISRT